MKKKTSHEKQWRTIHRVENDIEQIVKTINGTVQELGIKKKYREFVSESHLSAYLYHLVLERLPLGWDIMVTPTMSTKKRRYKENAKNIPTLFKPDIVIYRKKTKMEEKKSEGAKVRFDCDRKNSVAIELSLQRPIKSSRKELKTAGIDFQKIEDDKRKYRNERFRYHCIYVNQHQKTTLTPEKFGKLAELCKEKWFHYTGEGVIDNANRLIFVDGKGNLVNSSSDSDD